MRRAPLSILGLTLLWVSCGVPRAAPERQLLPDGSPVEGQVEVDGHAARPALRAQIPWSNAGSLWGWGALRLWGRPRENELQVHAIVDAPARSRRWGSQCAVRMRIDEREISMPASYIGRPMTSGVYDAVRVDLRIEQLRDIGRAKHVEGEVCGDRFEIGVDQRATVRRFVDQFDRLSVPGEPPRGFTPSLGPDTILPGEDDEKGPTPA